jgi:hypothetical protein
LVTYDPRNIKTGVQREGIRISMDGKNYCNWNILDLLSYSFFLVDRQITTDPRGQIQFASYKDPRTVVSVGDSNSMGTWPIGADGKLVTGYDTISQAGRLIKGKLYNDVHELLVLGIKTPDHGVVVASPMGMAPVSAIQLRDWVKLGAAADKGWEFANFAFGGSDFVVIFEKQADFELTVPQMAKVPPGAGVNYEPSLQGQRYGCFGGSADCDTTPAVPPPYPGFD